VPEYEQHDRQGVRAIFGLEDEQALNQPLGDVITCEDRCIAFPNLFQHRVQPFQLIDPTKPGYRKILVFFLVDPTQSILSTANVPPQQRSWFLEHLHATPPFNKLPIELVTNVLEFSNWPMSLEEARAAREALMTERKYVSHPFSCDSFLFRPFFMVQILCFAKQSALL
jgi:hypothetical protein